MKDWKSILYAIYTPEIGSIWVAPNGIWTNSFATNKGKLEVHPSIIGKVSLCKTNCQIIPGTTKTYKTGTCVFKLKIKAAEPLYPFSHFLINLWMTYSISDVLKLKQGWDGIDNLDEDQLNALKMQIKFCKGINV
jgi:hypothetical protein